jgi:hypothetical protein
MVEPHLTERKHHDPPLTGVKDPAGRRRPAGAPR